VIDEFFLKDDFALRGLAFCVMDGERMVAFAASNYPLRGNDLEVFVRVADDPAYRRKGLGTAVSAALLSCCLERGITPHWDAANDASTALALKLGYIKTETWAMYHTKRGA
jgi:GNAT superfamily N-acetyltransferase